MLQSSKIFFVLRFLLYLSIISNGSLPVLKETASNQIIVAKDPICRWHVSGSVLPSRSRSWERVKGSCGETLWTQVHLSDGNSVPLPTQETVLLFQLGYIHMPLGGHAAVATEVTLVSFLYRDISVSKATFLSIGISLSIFVAAMPFVNFCKLFLNSFLNYFYKCVEERFQKMLTLPY